MKKLYIVKTKRQFEDIIKKGNCIKNKYYVIHYKDNDLPYDRYGISVSKKLGNAVTRNKYKRKIRSILDNYKKLYKNNKDYIIILRKEAINKPYSDMEKELFALMNKTMKGNLLNEKEQ